MKRFRIFAGPNGSGKSTIFKAVSGVSIHGNPIDLGIYVNADDIAALLLGDKFCFSDFGFDDIDNDTFRNYAINSGLLRNEFSTEIFDASYTLTGTQVRLTDARFNEVCAQLLSNFMINELIKAGKKCTMETVFSHKSKIEMMQHAVDCGYKVYLYFVSTGDAEINVGRVRSRVIKGGHAVPEDTIRSRYYRSLSLLYEAAQISYQCFFFDNSASSIQLVNHFKKERGIKVWDTTEIINAPDWFVEYYLNKT